MPLNAFDTFIKSVTILQIFTIFFANIDNIFLIGRDFLKHGRIIIRKKVL